MDTEAWRFEGLAQGHLGSERARGEPEPRTVWPWPLKCQFSPEPLLLLCCPPSSAQCGGSCIWRKALSLPPTVHLGLPGKSQPA